ncbi:hypothetical protein [Ketogulonicigenium vulgare]|uniref:hypothetical protein n=1 Tax=Ketogulonicigenium vulgare TaxID=92945 RepID=UPI00235A3DA2|nr:hypothetical protein [Ketogulonicigenium vulgare]
MPAPIQPAPEIVLCHGEHVVVLRASLRAAMELSKRPDGLAGLYKDLTQNSIRAIHAVIRHSNTDRVMAERLIVATANKPLASFMVEAQAACLSLLAQLLPMNDDHAPQATANAAPRPLSEYLGTLYTYATGWLNWPPSEVWNASVHEIEVAFMAHVDRLAMMNGTKESKPDNQAQREANIKAGLDPDFDRAGLAALKAKL